MTWLRRILCPSCTDGDEIAGMAREIEDRLDRLMETGEEQLAETRTIRRDLAAVRRRIIAADFPLLGELPPDTLGEGR